MIAAVITGRAQTFEGTLAWSMKLEVTDPKAKAQMEEARKKAADPANQAKMKEMQAKMNDPQFKAMMDSNPQMKAQMETMLKMMAGGDMSSMMPSAIVVKMKGTNTLTSIHGGIMDKNDLLYLSDKSTTYTINHSSKTYMVMKNTTSPSTSERKPKVTKTSETAKILGYNCTKYIIENTTPDGKTVITNYWATTEIKDIDLKALAKQQMNKEQSFIYEDVEGVPLKIEVTMPQMGIMSMQATELKKESIPASTFVLPAGYTESKI